jgi:hypothetical protein
MRCLLFVRKTSDAIESEPNLTFVGLWRRLTCEDNNARRLYYDI